MKVAYISGAYRSQDGPNGILANIMAARALAIELWRVGYAVLCPHCNTFLMDGAASDSVWLAGDLELLRRCDLIVMLPGWGASEGARQEFREAMARGIPAYGWPEDRGVLAGLAALHEPAETYKGQAERLASAA